MKILFVITSLGVGGAERMVTTLADKFVSEGHEVVLSYFHGPASLKPLDARVSLVDLCMARRPYAVIRSLWRLRRLIREFEPDVVNSHLVHANVLTRLLRIVTPMRRLISSAHITNEGKPARMLAYRVTDWLADISTNVSDEAVELFRQKGGTTLGRMITVFNGIDTTAFVFDPEVRERLRAELSIGENTSVLLAVGRLWNQKDYPNLLRAVALLSNMDFCPQLLIVGDGPLRAQLVDLAESLGVAPQVRFLGVRHDVPELMSICDVFVLSSSYEGFGLVVAEAMACERLVVATNCGGVKEVLGDCGFLVAPRDPESLAESMSNALKLSKREACALGHDARKRVIEKFSLATTAENYLAVYRSAG
ncbi:glycosyltransferase [Endozoicomonas sp. G2_2]|uniref:glycosyltransferase n=1 Tax=Endozoicomonas sp. G2_2 TaxID=2821092 RepID=UPI001ADBCD7C|nr:glycosyltransferase [Endozoicomonas sp. G2_2]MBO9470138.1 glycosyltransferase [Endozoicomonas sp. G2_2]